MTMIWQAISGGLEPAAVISLLLISFAGSFITVALGIGGGALVLAVMASLLPPAALIPVHGVVQVGSNILRALVLLPHVHWAPFAAFAAGTLAGVALGGVVVVELPPSVVLIGIGLFVVWTVFFTPPRWLTRWPAVTGWVSSTLTMFFGATGLFVASYVKSLKLERQRHVATHAALMTTQHLLKVFAFGLLGFAYGPWIGFIAAMIVAGFLGTLGGRMVLVRISDHGFKRALDVLLVLISARLIWSGLSDLLGS